MNSNLSPTSIKEKFKAVSPTASFDNILTQLKDLFVTIHNQKKKTGSVSPREFIRKLRQENELFRAPIHHDAHEFLNYTLNAVADILLKQHEHVLQLQNGIDGKSRLEEGDSEIISNLSPESKEFGGLVWFDSLEVNEETFFTTANDTSANTPSPTSTKPKTWIHELFEGILANEIKCLQCEEVSQRTEPFLDLSLDIPSDNCSVSSCLKYFSKPELLSGKDKFFCNNCNSLQEAHKRMKIKKLPRILALHLKRFKYIEKLQRHVKLTHRVSFPLNLRLSPQNLLAGSGDYFYRLTAVVVHVGVDPSHGHYVSIVKSMDKWYVFDDTFVEAVEENYLARVFGWGASNNHGVDEPNGDFEAYVNKEVASKGYGNVFEVVGTAEDHYVETKITTAEINAAKSTTSTSSTSASSGVSHSLIGGSGGGGSLTGKNLLSYGCGYILFYEAVSGG